MTAPVRVNTDVTAPAPPEVKATVKDYYSRYTGPAGMTQQDDMENWHWATAGSKGTIGGGTFCVMQQPRHQSDASAIPCRAARQM